MSLTAPNYLCWTYDEDGERRMLLLYQDLDRELAELCAEAPPGSRILAVSAYGIYANYPLPDVAEQILRGLGYQHSPPPNGRSPREWIPLAARQKIGEWLPASAQQRMIS